MARQPNILFSMCDDQRHDCMRCAGHPFIDTPTMDRLAREGIRFANGFTAIPLCAPSRASHLSGVYPHTHQAAHNRAPIRPDLVIPIRFKNLAFCKRICYGVCDE